MSKRILIMLIAIASVCAMLLASCGGASDPSGTADPSGTQNSADVSGDQNPDETTDETADPGGETADPDESAGTGAANGTTRANVSGTNATTRATSAPSGDPYANIPAKLKGVTVNLLIWNLSSVTEGVQQTGLRWSGLPVCLKGRRGRRA